MSYDYWPASLPQVPLLDGNEAQAVSMRVTFQPDRGPPMDRQGATLANFVMPWNFNLSEAQKDTFKTFFHTTLGQGSARFYATDPYEEETCVMKFIGDYVLRKHSPGKYSLQSMVRRVS